MRPVKSPEEAAQALEALLLRQLISSSGVFKADGAGGQLRTDMFVEAMAEAVAKAGGLGIAKMIQAETGGLDDPRDAAILEAEVGHDADPAPGKASAFGWRQDPIDGTRKYHTGVDMAVPEGTPVRAVREGVVREARSRGGYGQAVEIDHGDGLATLYAHNSQLLVKPGERVEAGQTIALSGETGRATGPHVHIEVRVADRPIDPRKALNAYGIRVEDTVAGKPRPPTRGTP